VGARLIRAAVAVGFLVAVVLVYVVVLTRGDVVVR
jgi:hypothetical protein